MFAHTLHSLPSNILGSFKGKKVWLHASAIGLTVLIVQTGFDWQYFLAVRDPLLNLVFFPALVIGGLLPIIAPLTLVIAGALRSNAVFTLTGWALAQAAFLGSVISSTYKAFTGRVQPDLSQLVVDSSHRFQFGFLEHGIFWGWPSSHTTIAFAMACALLMLFPKKYVLACVAIVYAFYIGFGVSLSIHWLSEFVAGTLIGIAIGLTVGESFARYSRAK